MAHPGGLVVLNLGGYFKNDPEIPGSRGTAPQRWSEGWQYGGGGEGPLSWPQPRMARQKV